jgi:hypothetical protein
MAANPIFTDVYCPTPRCWGRLDLINSEERACLECGEVFPLHDPADLTEADTDLFNIPGIKCTAAELEPQRWHRDRGEWDALDDKSDINPWTRTTRY